ncbi:pyridoxamine 5'-phosphate oxidase family protein [Neptunitalea lumnitzerae]|uniref:Pyridoxamine 5'-phosphate oxidase putative domain-containing protein n=1 Tax=Neptunitalea lumnitzerae TaxID=2965509 RepID=A0ABQ5MKE7_9FLAO|nr:pyridoxamine 5'-phosphate oxidase family protein [Neptunitalea sp. Y10]GLB49407.1 hypothetical protein Y10_17750 [Neptunitalea sp. Y10]
MKQPIIYLVTILLFTGFHYIHKTSSKQSDLSSIDAISGASSIIGSPKIKIQDVDASVVYDSLSQIGIYFISTIYNNKPKVRPYGNIHLHEGKIWFFVDKRKATYQELKENPSIEIAATKGQGGKFIRVTGTAVLEDNQTLIEKIAKENPYFEGSGYEIGVFYISDALAELPSNTGPTIVRF